MSSISYITLKTNIAILNDLCLVSAIILMLIKLHDATTLTHATSKTI